MLILIHSQLDSDTVFPVPNPSPKILEHHYWLDTDDMETASKLITQQWPGIVSQSCLLIQRNVGFNAVKVGQKYVQVNTCSCYLFHSIT
jgi:hypothetical protein